MEDNWIASSVFFEKLTQLLLQSRLDTRNYSGGDYVDKEYQIEIPMFREFASNMRSSLINQEKDLILEICIYSENTKTQTKYLCEQWIITSDLKTPPNPVTANEISTFLQYFKREMENLPFYKLATKVRSTPDYFTVGYEMNSTRSTHYQPNDPITSMNFVALPTKFGTIRIDLIRLLDCSHFSEPKLLHDALRDSYLPVSNNNACEVKGIAGCDDKQPILKQREVDPFFFDFLQSSCPDALLKSSKPFTAEFKSGVRKFYEENLHKGMSS